MAVEAVETTLVVEEASEAENGWSIFHVIFFPYYWAKSSLSHMLWSFRWLLILPSSIMLAYSLIFNLALGSREHVFAGARPGTLQDVTNTGFGFVRAVCSIV